MANLRSLRYDDPILDDIAQQAADAVGVPANLLNAIRNAERSKNSYVRSNAGAMGLYQFIPATAKAYDLEDPTDPVASTFAAARYLKDLLKQYEGDPIAAAAHYNGGGSQGKLILAGKNPSKNETAKYVKAVQQRIGPKTFDAKKATPTSPYEVPNTAPTEPGLAGVDPLMMPPTPARGRGQQVTSADDPYGIAAMAGATPTVGAGPTIPSFGGGNSSPYGGDYSSLSFGKGPDTGVEYIGAATEPDYGVPYNPIANIDPGRALTAELRKLVDSVVG